MFSHHHLSKLKKLNQNVAFILDIVGSMAIRGAIVLVMINLVLTLNTALYDRTAQANTRQNLGATADIMYQDIKYAGYRLPANNTFSTSKTNDLKFSGDFNDNGTVASDEEVRYYGVFDATNGVWKLYRVYGTSSPLMVADNLQSFLFTYYDNKGRSTNDKDKVESLEVTLVGKVSGISTTDTTTTTVFKVFPMNL